jgi:hypothetical protein
VTLFDNERKTKHSQKRYTFLMVLEKWKEPNTLLLLLTEEVWVWILFLFSSIILTHTYTHTPSPSR